MGVQLRQLEDFFNTVSLRMINRAQHSFLLVRLVSVFLPDLEQRGLCS